MRLSGALMKMINDYDHNDRNEISTEQNRLAFLKGRKSHPHGKEYLSRSSPDLLPFLSKSQSMEEENMRLLIDNPYYQDRIFSQKQREIFEMMGLKGLSFRECAKRLNLSVASIRDRMRGVRKILKKWLTTPHTIV